MDKPMHCNMLPIMQWEKTQVWIQSRIKMRQSGVTNTFHEEEGGAHVE